MKMLKSLKERVSIEESTNDINTRIDFELHNELIYHKENRRLCVSTSVEYEIFRLIHDQN